MNLSIIIVSKIITEALSMKEWKEAMDQNMQALEENNTWELVRLPNGKKVVSCK